MAAVLQKSFNILEPNILPHFTEYHGNLRKHIDAMKNPSVYGDSLEVVAIAQLARCQVHIVQKTMSTFVVTQKIPTYICMNTEPIVLLYTPEQLQKAQPGHYQLLMRRNSRYSREDRWDLTCKSVFPPTTCSDENVHSLLDIISSQTQDTDSHILIKSDSEVTEDSSQHVRKFSLSGELEREDTETRSETDLSVDCTPLTRVISENASIQRQPVHVTICEPGLVVESCPSDISQTENSKLCRPILDSYPFRQFGKNKRRFQCQLYSSFSWLEYSTKCDAAFCFPCRFFARDKGPFSGKGFSDWQHATGHGYGLTAHNVSASHRFAMIAWEQHKLRVATSSDVTQLMDRGHIKMKQANRMYIKTLAEIILFCGRQELALRGDNEEEHSLSRGNFLELVQLVARHDSEFAQRLAEVRGNATYLSPQIQNDIVFSISEVILDTICSRVTKSACFALLADETKDASKIEQISIILRFINIDSDTWSVEERFLGFVAAASCNAETLTKHLVDTVSKRGLSMKNCVAQAYDGATVMSGSCTGVQARIQQHAPMAVYIHCMAHRLNLVLVDVCKNVNAASEFFALLEAVYVFMSSGTSHPAFLDAQNRIYPDRRPLELKRIIETRWSCRYESIETIIKVFTAVIQTLERISDTHHSAERAALARGYLHQLKRFQFVSLLLIMERILRITYSLSNALQDPELDLAAAVTLINSVTGQLRELRGSSEKWEEIWVQVAEICAENDIAFQPTVTGINADSLQRPSRPSKIPGRLQDYFVMNTIGARHYETETNADQAAENNSDSPSGHKNSCRDGDTRVSVFIVMIDHVLTEMDKRFGPLQNSFYSAIQSLQPTSPHFMSHENIQPLISHYSEFLLPRVPSSSLSQPEHSCDTYLAMELAHAKAVLRDVAPNANTMLDVVNALRPLKAAFPRVLHLYQLALTLPVSTASCERSFSCIKRVKTYSRTSMTEARLCGLGLMSIENELTRDNNFLDNVVQKFAEGGARRIAL